VPTALVLSAGGMFSAWQAGVWSVLAPQTQPDLVVGASAGALSGWAIAGGALPSELTDAWLDPSIADLIHFRFGLTPFDPALLHRTAATLIERYTPRLPFALTLVEVPRLRLHIVRGPDVTARHLVAACSIPLGFPPVRIDGTLFVDGGLLGALPVWAAAQLGATRILALDALPAMPSAVLRAAVAPLWRFHQRRRPLPPGIEIAVIRPSRPLGTLRDALYWKAGTAQRWIEQGQEDGQQSPEWRVTM
jgi:NTE family protein